MFYAVIIITELKLIIIQGSKWPSQKLAEKRVISMRNTLLNDPLHVTILKVIITCDRDGRFRKYPHSFPQEILKILIGKPHLWVK